MIVKNDQESAINGYYSKSATLVYVLFLYGAFADI